MGNKFCSCVKPRTADNKEDFTPRKGRPLSKRLKVFFFGAKKDATVNIENAPATDEETVNDADEYSSSAGHAISFSVATNITDKSAFDMASSSSPTEDQITEFVKDACKAELVSVSDSKSRSILQVRSKQNTTEAINGFKGEAMCRRGASSQSLPPLTSEEYDNKDHEQIENEKKTEFSRSVKALSQPDQDFPKRQTNITKPHNDATKDNGQHMDTTNVQSTDRLLSDKDLPKSKEKRTSTRNGSIKDEEKERHTEETDLEPTITNILSPDKELMESRNIPMPPNDTTADKKKGQHIGNADLHLKTSKRLLPDIDFTESRKTPNQRNGSTVDKEKNQHMEKADLHNITKPNRQIPEKNFKESEEKRTSTRNGTIKDEEKRRHSGEIDLKSTITDRLLPDKDFKESRKTHIQENDITADKKKGQCIGNTHLHLTASNRPMPDQDIMESQKKRITSKSDDTREQYTKKDALQHTVIERKPDQDITESRGTPAKQYDTITDQEKYQHIEKTELSLNRLLPDHDFKEPHNKGTSPRNDNTINDRTSTEDLKKREKKIILPQKDIVIDHDKGPSSTPREKETAYVDVATPSAGKREHASQEKIKQAKDTNGDCDNRLKSKVAICSSKKQTNSVATSSASKATDVTCSQTGIKQQCPQSPTTLIPTVHIDKTDMSTGIKQQIHLPITSATMAIISNIKDSSTSLKRENTQPSTYVTTRETSKMKNSQASLKHQAIASKVNDSEGHLKQQDLSTKVRDSKDSPVNARHQDVTTKESSSSTKLSEFSKQAHYSTGSLKLNGINTQIKDSSTIMKQQEYGPINTVNATSAEVNEVSTTSVKQRQCRPTSLSTDIAARSNQLSTNLDTSMTVADKVLKDSTTSLKQLDNTPASAMRITQAKSSSDFPKVPAQPTTIQGQLSTSISVSSVTSNVTTSQTQRPTDVNEASVEDIKKSQSLPAFATGEIKKVSDFDVPKGRKAPPMKPLSLKPKPKHLFAVPSLASTDIEDESQKNWTQHVSTSKKAQMPWMSLRPKFNVAFPKPGKTLLQKVGSIDKLVEKRVVPLTKRMEKLRAEFGRFPGVKVGKNYNSKYPNIFNLTPSQTDLLEKESDCETDVSDEDGK